MLDNPDKFPLWEVSTCVFFAFPMLIMVVLYSRMGLKIRSRSRHTLALGESHSPLNFFRGSLFVSIKLNCYCHFAVASQTNCFLVWFFMISPHSVLKIFLFDDFRLANSREVSSRGKIKLFFILWHDFNFFHRLFFQSDNKIHHLKCIFGCCKRWENLFFWFLL